MKVTIAPDSFKGSLAARDVASAISGGWLSERPNDEVQLLPQADGGEGTLDAVESAVPGAIRHAVGLVTGPDGRPTPGEWLELPGRVAVVELAQMSGLPLLEELSPGRASTRGLGEVIRFAIDAGMTGVVIGLGGSASTDGAVGALSALGARFLDESGAVIDDGGTGLEQLASIDLSGLVPAPSGGVTLLTDVDNPLLGASGAAAVFGPQKGANQAQVARLDDALARLAGALGGDPRAAGAGAAGGAGYGFATAWGARIEPGARYLSSLSGLPDSIAAADVVITGEGRFDATSLGGKLVGHVLELAGESTTRVGVVAGLVDIDEVAFDGGPPWTQSLTALAGSARESMAHPQIWLHEAGVAAARALAPSYSGE